MRFLLPLTLVLACSRSTGNTRIDEDPVTGSAHTTLIPYWSDKLNSSDMLAKQVSERGGVLHCKNQDTRVLIGGKAVLYMKGEIEVN